MLLIETIDELPLLTKPPAIETTVSVVARSEAAVLGYTPMGICALATNSGDRKNATIELHLGISRIRTILLATTLRPTDLDWCG